MEKKMTPCEELGYKVGDRFRVCDDNNYYHGWGVDTIVVLIEDDGSVVPKFQSESDPEEKAYMKIQQVRPLTKPLKTGDEITQGGKKYRVTLEEIPQYDFKPGIICVVDWDKADASCVMHSDCMRVVFLGNRRSGREKIAYAATDGDLAIGFVNTSSLHPE